MFERENISGSNYNDWFRSPKMVLRVEKKLFVIEQPISPAPPADSKYLRSGMRFMMLITRLLVLCSEKMEPELIVDVGDGGMEKNNAANVDNIGHQVDDLFAKVEKLEQRVNEIEQFYLSSSKKQSSASQKSLLVKDKDKVKHIPGFKKHQQEAARRDAVAAKRMQEIMRQFGSILRQITQHKLAWPFMQPVDVEGLGLRDYYEVIDRPMDFSTIKNQMDAKDGTEYKHVRDICSDVRLVFQNAMKYNDDNSGVYSMAKNLLEKFEEKWLQFLPRVIEEEKRQEEEEAEALSNIQRAQEAAHAKIARDLRNEVLIHMSLSFMFGYLEKNAKTE
ncbi:transcription factor GTE6-like protein [Tanacetum coccineum]